MKKLLFLLLLVSCQKVDNSELGLQKVMFYNQRTDTVEIHIKETGSVFGLNPGDSINYPVSFNTPSLVCVYSVDTIHDKICGLLNPSNPWNNVKSKNIIK
jgi:hypothetical protein